MNPIDKPAFKPSSFDDARPDTDDLRDYARSVGAPAYGGTGLAPRDEPEVEQAREERADEDETEALDEKPARGRSKARRVTKDTANRTIVSLGLKIPKYVRDQLKKKAINEDVTVRYIIMNALREQYNITIYADDMLEDGRNKN